MKFLASRKWMLGTLYVSGVILCDLLKHPLSPDALQWTGMVVLILIGGQAAIDHKGTVVPKVN